MHNVVKWLKYFKNLAVSTPQDFKSMFGHFTTLCMKELNPVAKIIFKRQPFADNFQNRCFLKCRQVFIGQHMCWSLFLIKLTAWNFIK